MEIHKQFDIYVGTVRGALAHTQCKPGQFAKFEFEREGKPAEITALEWGTAEDEILLGYKNGIVQCYNILHEKYVGTIPNEQTGSVLGITTLPSTVIYTTSNGYCNIWTKKHLHSFSFNLDSSNGCTLESTAQNKLKPQIIGTGGVKNDLKLWDFNTKQCTFKAKSMPHNELSLAVPTSIRSLAFFATEENLISCVTKEGCVLLYDERAQRRPVTKFVEPKASYTTIANTYTVRQCVAGTTKGYMQLIDLRSPTKCIKTYKSFTGSVTSIVCDPVKPIIISTSLDRFLRIHNLETKELLYKEYVKQSLTKLLVRPIIKKEEENEEKEIQQSTEDQEYESLFENMETITEKKIHQSKKRLVHDTPVKSNKKKKQKQTP